jgi:hypothetical protein
MTDANNPLDNELRKMYARHAAAERDVEAVMQRIGDRPASAARRPWARIVAVGIVAMVTAAALGWLLFGRFWPQDADPVRVAQPSPSSSADAADDDSSRLPPPPGISESVGIPRRTTPHQDDPIAASTEEGTGSGASPSISAGTAPPRRTVVLQIPAADAPFDAQQLEQPKWEAELIFLGTLGRAEPGPRGTMLPLVIDDVIKGPEVDGRLVTRDELPVFTCETAGPQVRPASQGFRAGDEVVAYLNRSGDAWELRRLEPAVPRFRRLLSAARSDSPRDELPPLLSLEAGGFDDDAKLMLEAVLTPEQSTPLLLDVLDGMPGELRGANEERKRRIVQQQLVPLCWMLALRHEPRLLKPAVAALALLDGQAWEEARFEVNYPLGIVVRVLVVTGRGKDFAEDDVQALRRLWHDTLRGYTDPARIPPAPVNGVWRNRADAEAVIEHIDAIADGETVMLLLAEQNRRPLTRFHPRAVGALVSTFSLNPQPLERTPWISEDDLRRMKAAWLETLLEFRPAPQPSADEAAFVEAVVTGLRGLSHSGVPLTDDELARIRVRQSSVSAVWYADALARLTRTDAERP